MDRMEQHVDFAAQVSHADSQSMEVLRYLSREHDLATTMSYYVELARKFLSEGKCDAARSLLTDRLESHLG